MHLWLKLTYANGDVKIVGTGAPDGEVFHTCGLTTIEENAGMYYPNYGAGRLYFNGVKLDNTSYMFDCDPSPAGDLPDDDFEGASIFTRHRFSGVFENDWRGSPFIPHPNVWWENSTTDGETYTFARLLMCNGDINTPNKHKKKPPCYKCWSECSDAYTPTCCLDHVCNPAWPECDFDEEECNSQSPDWPECCEENDCHECNIEIGECQTVFPTCEPGSSSWPECCEENPCHKCNVDGDCSSCCDPCPLLNELILKVEGLQPGGPSGYDILPEVRSAPSLQPPTPSWELPTVQGGVSVDGFTFPVKIPGQSNYSVRHGTADLLNSNLTDVIPGVAPDLVNLQNGFRSMILIYAWYRFATGCTKLVYEL
ncbi:hypothetical protein [Pseudobythopirellula maris]|uniref:hypothetical protein n=1 Tax=Pseudobythopirellula maris TaxID=2527991 RepID=UPI0011B5BD53|nr:hypothetical protein [Pseudobythopirellula maris]